MAEKKTPQPKHPPLEWRIDDSSGILSVKPIGPVRGTAWLREDMLHFHDEQDAIRQFYHLISLLHRRIYEKNPTHCSACNTVIPYEVTQSDPEWTCPLCRTQNMGK